MSDLPNTGLSEPGPRDQISVVDADTKRLKVIRLLEIMGVTSVGLDLPAELFDIVFGSVTGSGLLTATLAPHARNESLMGPQVGGPAAPGFRRPKAGAANTPVYVSGGIYQTTADVNPAEIGSTPLALGSFVLLGESLYNIGDSVDIEMEYSVAGNTNVKAIGIVINGNVADSQITASSSILCGTIRAKLIKTGSNTQKLCTQITFNTFKPPLYQTTTLTDTADITIAAVGYASVATTDLTLRSMEVNFREAA